MPRVFIRRKPDRVIRSPLLYFDLLCDIFTDENEPPDGRFPKSICFQFVELTRAGT